jgi:hypothetical protein
MLAPMGRGGTPGALALGGAPRGWASPPSPGARPRAALAAGLACAALAFACATTQVAAPGRAVDRSPAAGHGSASLPLAAQGPISATLGGAETAYRLKGLQAVTPSQHLRADFSSRGVTVASGNARVSLMLSAYGYASALGRVAPVAPSARANRVSYSHGALSEWFVNGPLGLEQGFSVSSRPRVGTGPLTFSIGLAGNLDAKLEHQSVLLAGAGARLRYGGLVVTDARGRLLHSWLALRDGHVLIRVEDHNATYPLRVDPFIQQGEQLSAGGAVGSGAFGTSVALSPDGDTALVGGPLDGAGVGSAWVFTRSGSTWTQQGPKLSGSGESGKGSFGSSVALGAEGSTALIGAPLDNNDAGAVWIFKRSGSTWTQQGPKLSGSGESGVIFFGKSVALSSSGATALIGGQVDNSDRGAAWVFTRANSSWRRRVKLAGSGASFQGRFGSSVALSANGRTALVGGYANEGVGGAWVFTRSGSKWRQQGPELTGSSESTGTNFGYSVALSDSGDTALIGGPDEAAKAGSAWVYTRSGSSWSQQGPKLTGGASAGSSFGSSVALSGNGNVALVGDPQENSDAGSAWVFTRSGSAWSEAGSQLIGGEESASGAFGASVALASNGATALVGGVTPFRFTGEAWVFVGPESVEPEAQASSAPVISRARETTASWREGDTPPSINTQIGDRPSSGTAFSFMLNVPARVTMTFSMRARCLARSGQNQAAHRCAHTLTFSARAGANSVRFDGVISKHTKLSPGSYTVLILASAPGGRSMPRALQFRIL